MAELVPKLVEFIEVCVEQLVQSHVLLVGLFIFCQAVRFFFGSNGII